MEKRCNKNIYEQLVGEIEINLSEIDDKEISNDEISYYRNYFITLTTLHFNFKIIFIVKQEERIEELKNIHDNFVRYC